ncbi:catalase [Annulohypoxylon nitens]|nr:catalase [Annulohypoxylon nitens]
MAQGTPYYTLAEGNPLPRNDTSVQIRTGGGGGGFVLLTSTQLLENLAHFSRERIPERAVHAKAGGARGYFEVTDDISDLTDADFLTGIGKKTEVLARISTVGPQSGSADSVRDFRGFAMKFKTSQGNHDFVFNNHPVFFVRDPTKFPSLNRSHKRDPRTNIASSDIFWDFHVHNQESIHALMFLFGDRGIPASFRHVNAYSGHTYKFTKADGSYHYVRIHFLTNQGIHYYTDEEGAILAGTDPDKNVGDLQDAIQSGNFPSWDMYVQVMRPEDIADAPIDVFDMTKIWPLGKYPRRRVGRMTLNKNPSNWFAEIEQASFSPSTMVPGIEASPDPMLHARMFAYPDAARYRLGVNYQFLPTNAPKSEVYCPIERDGAMNFTSNYGGDPSYIGTKVKPARFLQYGQEGQAQIKQNGGLDQAAASNPVPVVFSSEVTDKDFEQSTALWHVMATQEGAQERFISNVSAHLSGAQTKWIRDEAYAMFRRVDEKLALMLEAKTEATVESLAKNDQHKIAWH